MLTVTLATGRVSSGGPEALGAVVFSLVVLWCFTHRRVDHSLLALAVYLGMIDGYVKLSTGSGTVTLARDVLVVAVAAGALLRTAQTKQRIYLPPLTGFVVAFVGIVLIELANPAARGLIPSLAGARQHLEFVPLFFLGFAFIRTKSQIRVMLIVLVLCASVGGIVSYIQSTLTPQQLADWGPGYSERILGTGDFAGAARVGFNDTGNTVRPFGLGSEVGSGAIVAALALPGLVALLMLARGWLRWCLVVMSVGVGLAVATSGSRSAIIVVVFSLLAFGVISASSRNVLKSLGGVVIASALIYAAFVQIGADNASTNRAKSIKPATVVSTFTSERGRSVALLGNLAREFPLGAGLATVGPAGGFRRAPGTRELNAETQWNFLVVELGIAGVLVYIAFLSRLMWLGMTRIRHIKDQDLRLYLAALAAPAFALLAAGFSGPTTASVPSAPFFWLVAGVLAYWLVTTHRGEGVRRGA